MEGCIIHEVLISPLAASGMTYEVLISQFLPGRLDLRGFDLIYCTIFGMIVLNFCLSVNSVKYYYFSSFFVNFNLSYAEHPRFFCLFSGKNQRFSQKPPNLIPNILLLFYESESHLVSTSGLSQRHPIYEVLISFWRFRASGRDTNLVNQLPASRQQRDQNLVNWSRPKSD